MSKQRICPNKECARYKRKPKRYYHCNQHEETKTCAWHNRIDSNKKPCPACVEVEPQQEHHCSKGHTIPLGGYCDVMSCGDYMPSYGNVCAYLDVTQPSQVQEKQCPECGHKAHKAGECYEDNELDIRMDDGYLFGCCPCGLPFTPANLKLEPVKPTPTLREQMPLITVRQVMVDAFLLLPYNTQIDTTDNEQMIRILDLLENEVVAWYRAKLEEIAEGLPIELGSATEGISMTRKAFRDGVSAQRKLDREAILKQREG